MFGYVTEIISGTFFSVFGLGAFTAALIRHDKNPGVLFWLGLWSGSYGLAMVICIAMVISMVVAGFVGVVIPIVLSALGQDPAQSSSIILTTVTDVAGFFSFLGIATVLSSML